MYMAWETQPCNFSVYSREYVSSQYWSVLTSSDVDGHLPEINTFPQFYFLMIFYFSFYILQFNCIVASLSSSTSFCKMELFHCSKQIYGTFLNFWKSRGRKRYLDILSGTRFVEQSCFCVFTQQTVMGRFSRSL